ncbi:DUF1203 domain-containing protein [Hyphomonas jannaschiana]|uniref:DUF1203 domain-containing protein n=1 Tax=Hyphomonas jannaschiana VP2 TaxID=1280952 RepID=A0A059FJX8_9PROT|nr:DUF1203 domain-containing protein [Hyphomonas jannaschiana]KCZ90960.1 hypothetical protein HJA_00440 [Hyphomonas jannaschiana VP2]
MSFRIRALPAAPFAGLSGLDEAALSARLIKRLMVDTYPGYPCRVSLEDARPGETVHLLHYTHQEAETPFRASHAIYVRDGVASADLPPGEVPDMIRRRIISLRAFDADGMMVNAEVTDGIDVAACIGTLFRHPSTDYIHLHFAKQGCFAARVDRA